ncbi:hypothetical protein [Streptomyces inhibens]|uniref:hypothetical protein n=1 Tax=Streptomyces inhibens TaxID=2293571 RepID=UPI00315A8FDB
MGRPCPTLAGHSRVRVHTGIGRDTRSDLDQDRRAYVWDNDGDTAPCATTTAAHRRFVDSESWGRHGHWVHGHWGHGH